MAKVKIKQFKNKAKEPVVGLTPEHAVYDANGVRLDAKLGSWNLSNIRNAQTESVRAVREAAKQYDHQTVINNGTITNAADEEDITVRDNVLSLKDRTYIEGIDEMGYVILRKNKSFAEQVTKENTIYEIRYAFTLSENITIPANCVLKFEGGSINGAYTITGSNTCIQAELLKIFDTNITFAGTWDVSEAYPEWFGAKGDFVNDDVQYIQKCLDTFKTCYLTGIYLITDTVILSTGYELIGKNNNVFLISRENIHIVKISSLSRYVKIKNVTIRHDGGKDNNNIIGIRTLDNVSNSVFEDIKIINCYYGLYLNTAFWQNNISNIRIDKCFNGITSGTSSASICSIFNNIYIGEYDNIAIKLNGVNGFSFYNLNIDASGVSNAIYLANSRIYINRFNVESFRGDIAIYCYAGSKLYLENGAFNDIIMSGNTKCLILCENNSTLNLNNVHYTKVETDNVYYGVINIASTIYSNNSNLTIRGNASDSLYTQQGTFNNKPSLSADIDKISTVYFATDFNKPIYWNGTYWVDGNGFSAAPNRGTTLERPKGVIAGGLLRTNDKGFCYFDTDLNKLIYVKEVLGNGVVTWVDAIGTQV